MLEIENGCPVIGLIFNESAGGACGGFCNVNVWVQCKVEPADGWLQYFSSMEAGATHAFYKRSTGKRCQHGGTRASLDLLLRQSGGREGRLVRV
jgi:hypothetical protein